MTENEGEGLFTEHPICRVLFSDVFEFVSILTLSVVTVDKLVCCCNTSSFEISPTF